MILGPPLAPATRTARPSRTPMVGDMLDSGTRPGPTAFAAPWIRPNAFGSPGTAAKSSISSFSTTPSSETTQLPHSKLIVSVQATALPAVSMTDR